MIKTKNIIKSTLGIFATMLCIIMMCTTVFADDCIRIVRDSNEAKAIVDEYKANGVKCNLTIRATSEELISYLKGEFEYIPMVTIYRPVQFELINGSVATTSPKNNATVSPTKDDDETSTVAPKEDVKTSTVAPKEDSSKKNKVEPTSDIMDSSPTTADGRNLKFALCVGLFAVLVIVSMSELKRRRQ